MPRNLLIEKARETLDYEESSDYENALDFEGASEHELAEEFLTGIKAIVDAVSFQVKFAVWLITVPPRVLGHLMDYGRSEDYF